MKLVTAALLAIQTIVVAANEELTQRGARFTCIEPAERGNRCYVSLGSTRERIFAPPFALKRGETIVFDELAERKWRCQSACVSAGSYEHFESENPHQPFDWIVRGAAQVVEGVWFRQSVFAHADVLPALMAADDFSGGAVPWSAAYPVGGADERYTCMGGARTSGLCDIFIVTTAHPSAYPLVRLNVGESIVYDRERKSLRECWGDACIPFTNFFNGRAPVTAVHAMIGSNRNPAQVVVKTWTWSQRMVVEDD